MRTSIVALSLCSFGCNLILGTEAPLPLEGGANTGGTASDGGGGANTGAGGGSGGANTGAGGEGGAPITCGGPSYAHWDPTQAPVYTHTPSVWFVVKDESTGLVWSRFVSNIVDHATAEAFCAGLSVTDNNVVYDDFRLPTRIEATTLVDYGSTASIKMDAVVFGGENVNDPLDGQSLWTGSLVPDTADRSYRLNIQEGRMMSSPHVDLSRARCVRSDTDQELGRCALLPDLGQGIVFDPATGLDWQINYSDVVPFGDAQATCTALGAGFRLPDVRELSTLLDDALTNPALDTALFQYDADYGGYPLFLTSDGSGGNSIVFDLRNATSSTVTIAGLAGRVRCVRGP